MGTQARNQHEWCPKAEAIIRRESLRHAAVRDEPRAPSPQRRRQRSGALVRREPDAQTGRAPPIPELIQLADLLEAEILGPSPWESLRDSLDGDFLYLTMAGSSEGSIVEEFIARSAPALGLVVYSPLTEELIGP